MKTRWLKALSDGDQAAIERVLQVYWLASKCSFLSSISVASSTSLSALSIIRTLSGNSFGLVFSRDCFVVQLGPSFLPFDRAQVRELESLAQLLVVRTTRNAPRLTMFFTNHRSARVLVIFLHRTDLYLANVGQFHSHAPGWRGDFASGHCVGSDVKRVGSGVTLQT